MKFKCLLVQRKLSRELVMGNAADGDSKIKAHLGRCPECSRALLEMRRLARGLSSALTIPGAQTEFTAQVLAACEPVRRSPSRHPAVGWAVCGVVALAMVGASFVWRDRDDTPAVSTSPPVAARKPQADVDNIAASAARQDRKAVVENVRPRTAKLHRHRQKSSFGVKAPQQRAVVVKHGQHRKSAQTNWADWGAYLESTGYYAQAEDAYALAYRQRQDPRFVYAAARSAESAGDVGYAVELYAAILNTPPAKDPPRAQGENR